MLEPITRLSAIASLVIQAERSGLRLSKEVQRIVEDQCTTIFAAQKNPAERLKFAQMLKETAIRMFRQYRYQEANVRYRMASLFNPKDVTLVSNRASCMYNMGKYRRCIDVCLTCLSSFPSLLWENTPLYFKILLRLGRSHIEMRSFSDASTVLKAMDITFLRYRGSPSFSISPTEYKQIWRALKEHIDGAVEVYKRANPGKSPMRNSPPHTKYFIQEDGILYQNPAFYEYDSADDDDDFAYDTSPLHSGRTIDLSQLCYHICPNGPASCELSFCTENEMGRMLGHKFGNGKYIGSNGKEGEEEISDESDMPELVSSDDETDAESDDDESYYDQDDMDDDDDGEDDNDDDDEDGDDEDPQAFPGMRSDHFELTTRNEKKSQFQSPPEDLSDGDSEVEEEEDDADDSGSIATALKTKKKSQTTAVPLNSRKKSSFGLKRGFLNGGNTTSGETKSEFESAKEVSQPASTQITYDTDEDNGPQNGNIFSDDVLQSVVVGYQKASMILPNDPWDFLANCEKSLFGKLFPSNRVVDFSRAFGNHKEVSRMGKKKKRSCDKKCGLCFARKMWKLRFVSGNYNEAARFFGSLDYDSRRKRKTFLSEILWRGMGFYASGYEMAMDIPALVHGVAYIALLQGEIHWQGFSSTQDQDIQSRFVQTLEENCRVRDSLNQACAIMTTIRETINLFEVLPNRGPGSEMRSFQLSKTASAVADEAYGTGIRDNSSLTAESKAALMTRSDNLAQNMHNWGALGHVSNEEERVYRYMLRDVSEMLNTIIARRIAKPLNSPDPDAWFSTFREKYGHGNNDEKYWKVRTISALTKQRARVLEQSASSRKIADLERSFSLLTKAIQVRPSQPRLRYKRAGVCWHQKRWDGCIRDVEKAQILLGEQKTAEQTETSLSPPQTLLLMHCIMLEGEAYTSKANEAGEDHTMVIKRAQQCFTKALKLSPKSKRTRSMLQKKIRALEMMKFTPPAQIGSSSSHPSPTVVDHSTSIKKRSERSGKLPTFKDGAHGSSSNNGRQEKEGQVGKAHQEANVEEGGNGSASDEDSDTFVAGNRYGALLDGGSSSSAVEASSSTTPTAAVSPDTSFGIGSSSTDPAHLTCDLCNVTSGSKADRDSHMKGRRHRSAVARARKAGLLPSGNGPTIELVFEEIKRVARLFDGEVHLSVLRSNVDLSSWNLTNSIGYVENKFGDLRTLCLEQSQMFQMRAGTDLDPLLTLVEADGFVPVLRRRQPHAVPSAHGENSSSNSGRRHQTQHENRRRGGDINAWGTANVQRGGAQASSQKLSQTVDYQNMVTQMLKLGGSSFRGDAEECCICLDNMSDVRVMNCKHVFCEACIVQHMSRDRSDCPSCRGDIAKLERLGVD